MKEKIEEKRKKISSKLVEIIKLSKEIRKEMDSLPVQNKMASKALILKNNTLITKNPQGIYVNYQKNKKRYDIQIYRKN